LRTNAGLSRFNAQIEHARATSHETSEKVRAAFADMLAGGYRIGGSGRLFGFGILSEAEFDGEDYGGEDGEPGLLTGPAAVLQKPERPGDPDEPEIIRELARRLLAGETVQSMADDLNARGITTTRGGPWAPRNLSRTLGNPLYGGQLAYRGETIGRLANVEPILDAETFQAVQDKLGARRRGPRATGKFPLSGVAVCGNPACSRRGTMAGVTRTGGQRAYICAVPGAVRGCGQSVLAAPVEAMVRDRVVALSHDAAALEAMRAADATLDAQREKLTGLLADLDADMDETEAKRAQAPRSAARLRARYDRNLASMAARYEATERELDALGPVSEPAPAVPPVTAEDWDDPEVTPADEQAAIIRRLGLPITIKPATRRQGASRLPFDAGRVSFDL
jgi:hypothetical protein